MRSAWPFLLALALADAVPARAQSCCSPSTTPGGAIAHHALAARRLQLGLYAQHLSLSGGRQGTESVPYPNDRQSNAQTVALIARRCSCSKPGTPTSTSRGSSRDRIATPL